MIGRIVPITINIFFTTEDKIMFCTKCGNRLKGDDLYCEKCGTKVNSTDTSGDSMITSQNYSTQGFNKPIKGIVLNIVSFLFTIIGICISLFSAYFKVGNFLKISLFSMGSFVEKVNKYLNLDEDAAGAFLLFKVIFWICIIDIIAAVVLLIIRFTQIRGYRYNTFSSYVPITPVFITIICLVFINKSDYFNAAMSYSMYVLIVLFISNLIIKKIGTNFNYYEIDRIIQRSNPESGIWICEGCGWKNSTADSHCKNCNAKH